MQEIIEAAVNKALEELTKKNMLKNKSMDAYKKTEQLLYNYNNFCEAIAFKKEKIEEIRRDGLPKTSKGINLLGVSGGEFLNEFDKRENKIEEIEESIRLTRKIIDMTNMALNSIETDEYYKIITLKYLKGYNMEDIACELGKDTSTISRNKTRLINDLKIKLFSDDVVRELLAS